MAPGEGQSGDTVRIIGTFRTFAGTLSNLASNPTLKIYDSSEVLVATIASGDITNDSTGVYHYDYTLPATAGGYFAEFSGTLEGKAIVRRVPIVVSFAE